MSRSPFPLLQRIVEAIDFDTLPPAWTTFDLAAFGRGKRLYPYQQAALRHALIALWHYYEQAQDFAPLEGEDADMIRKAHLWARYQTNGADRTWDIPLAKLKGDVEAYLRNAYDLDGERLPFQQLVNRLGFWMATGSGKTLVLVKLLELLGTLMQRGEVPRRDLLVLTHRDDLLAQIRGQVEDYNAAGGLFHLRLHDLRQYEAVKRGMGSLLQHQELDIFLYRSDNIGDSQKDKLLDFRLYDNRGEWYLLLDEAHRGDNEDSKRQHLYSILTRRGFLFNFSATFTDPRDIYTTAYNFNLARFTQEGFGKHLALLQQDVGAFKQGAEDLTGEEKRLIVLKTLILLALARCQREKLAAKGHPDAYHSPMLMVLGNTVSVDDADVEQFFREVAAIARDEVPEPLWADAVKELRDELSAGVPLFFEEPDTVQADLALLGELTLTEVRRLLFHSPAPGTIEVLVRPSDNKELAFKLKSAAQPFALLKIGDTKEWRSDKLRGYEQNPAFDEESFFERLAERDSPINLLIGSQSFYEGWDSTRPNVILFINIGSRDAKKFVVQAIGRGVRVEPLRGQRRRLQSLVNAAALPLATAAPLQPAAQTLETLFILGTSSSGIRAVIEGLQPDGPPTPKHKLALARNDAAIQGQPLLIPTYRDSNQRLIEQSEPVKFPLREDEQAMLADYVRYMADDRLLLARHDLAPSQVNLLSQALKDPTCYFRYQDAPRYGDVALIVPRVIRYFDLIPQELEAIKPLDDEISHFKNITVTLQEADWERLSELVERVQRFPTRDDEKRRLKEAIEAYQITIDDYTEQVMALGSIPSQGRFHAPPGQSLHPPCGPALLPPAPPQHRSESCLHHQHHPREERARFSRKARTLPERASQPLRRAGLVALQPRHAEE